MSKKIESITIGIAVNDLQEAILWYKTLLGDVEIIEPAPGTFELKLSDNAWLQLDASDYLKVGGGSSIIRLEVKDINTAYQKVKELTSDLGSIELVDGVLKYFDFKDPSGNRLSFYQLV